MTCLYHIRFRIQSYYLISLISYFGCWLVSNLSEVDLIQLIVYSNKKHTIYILLNT